MKRETFVVVKRGAQEERDASQERGEQPTLNHADGIGVMPDKCCLQSRDGPGFY
jgi:hypothetical protein